ncbi:DUF6462 family protein, partial [Fusicatenibacter sp.]
MKTENMYYNQQKRSEVKEEARRLRRKFLRYQQAEIVYSLSHKKLMELANDAGAIYRMDGIVLINREIFDEYLEQFHEKQRNVSSKKRGFEMHGKVWMFSHLIDDEDIEFMQHEFISYR